MSRATIIVLLSIVLTVSGVVFSDTVSVPQVVRAVGASHGIAVVVGDAACEFALALAQGSELLIYVQVPSTKDFESACRKVEEAGYYGSRIFVEQRRPEAAPG